MQSLALYSLPVGTGLVAIPGATEGYRVPKDAVAEAATLIFIAGWTLKHVWAADLTEAFRALREVPCLTPLTCFVVWTFVTAFASPNRRFSSTVEVNVVLFFLLYVLSYHEWNHARVRRWIALVTLAAVLNGILMLLQRAKMPLGGYLSYEMSLPDRYRMAGFIGNPNDVGNYLVLAFLLTCAGALIARSWLPRVTCAIALLFLCVLVVWTETYTSIAALGAALLVSFALFAWMRPRLAFRVGSFVFLALLLGAAAAFWQLSKNPESRRLLRATVSAARAGHWIEALHGRYFPWRITADMIDDRPFLGHGPGTFSYIFFDYQLRFKAAHPGVVTQREYFDQTHNDYLQIAAEMGAPSLLLLG